MRDTVSNCVIYLQPRYQRLKRDLHLQQYSEPASLLSVLKSRDYEIILRLASTQQTSTTISALTIVFAPMLKQYAELLGYLDINPLSLVWELLPCPFENTQQPHREFEQRVKNHCKNELAKKLRRDGRFTELDLPPFFGPVDMKEAQRLC